MFASRRRRIWFRRSYMILSCPADCSFFNVVELHYRTIRTVSCVNLLRGLQCKHSSEIRYMSHLRDYYFLG